MNWINYRFIILVISFVLTTTIEARGGRGGGGRSGGGRSSGGSHRSGSSSGSRSSGGGFWGSLFGGSSSSSKSSSPHSSSSSSSSNWKPYQHTSYNSYPLYQHTYNNDNNFGSRPPKASDSTDFMHGYMTGNMLSHDFRTLGLPENILNTNSDHSYNHGYVYPRLSNIANDHPGSMGITTTTEMTTSGMLDILNELNKPFDSNESLDSFLDRMSKVDFSKVWNTDTSAGTTMQTTSTTSEMTTTTTELPNSTTESTTTVLELTSSKPAADNIQPNEDVLVTPKASSGEIVPVTTESTPEANLDISTPYGIICSPIVYTEVNEFGVTVTIEKLGCYPAPEPVIPFE